MPARMRHYPGRGPRKGISGTRAAYDPCAGCGHARVKHLTGPVAGCSATDMALAGDRGGQGRQAPGTCQCPGFTGREE